jgi:DNA (cytosine-5)-methyltransferase 1
VNVLSLFSGAGLFELGLERAGMTTVGQVERDPYCQKVLARHFPGVPQHDDVTTAADWWLGAPRPIVDVVCGGFPCQPFSNAGAMLGTLDERWMWPAMADVVRRVGPRYVLVENVASLVRDRTAFGRVLGDLAQLGFDAVWTVYSAADFGAPHNRERLYLLAYPPSLNGVSRDRVGSGGKRRPPFPTGGLPRPSAHQRRRLASEWLEREPRVDRLANGVPAQVDRLRLAGNAVVPQIPEHIGRLIVEAETTRAAA